MPARIVVFGATGYTGRLVAEALVERGARPLLAARSAERLTSLSAELGGLETAVADVSNPESVRALIGEGDVLVSTVGPFARWGDPAVEAAAAVGATYLDSTGEPGFIRRVFDRYGPQAKVAGAALVTAFGYDWVPGNLAGALALREAGERATRVAIGYFMLGGSSGSMSGGTQASSVGAMLEPGYAWRDGDLSAERAARRIASFDVEGRRLQAVSMGASEHLTLPRLYGNLLEVDVYLGWFGPLSRPVQAVSAAMEVITRIPGAKAAIGGALGRVVKGSSGGPDAEQRGQVRSYIVAVASDPDGNNLAEARVAGVDGYTFTGKVLAWGADRAASGGLRGTGAIGPVEAFGLDELEAGCAEAGLRRVSSPGD